MNLCLILKDLEIITGKEITISKVIMDNKKEDIINIMAAFTTSKDMGSSKEGMDNSQQDMANNKEGMANNKEDMDSSMVDITSKEGIMNKETMPEANRTLRILNRDNHMITEVSSQNH